MKPALQKHKIKTKVSDGPTVCLWKEQVEGTEETPQVQSRPRRDSGVARFQRPR